MDCLLGVIQIIRDTLGCVCGWMGSAMCNILFTFCNTVFGSEKFGLTARLGLRDTVFLFHFAVYSKLSLNSVIKMSHGGIKIMSNYY